MSNLNNQVLKKVRQQIRNDYKQNPYASYHGGKLQKKKNPWIEKVKLYSKTHDIPYKEALTILSKSNKGKGLIMY